MWSDLKKIGNSLLEQTIDQKELILFNLRVKSLSEKQESAFARLGSLVYTPLKGGNTISPDDEELKSLLAEIEGIEKEVEETGLVMKKIKTESASGRDRMVDDIEKAWNKTRTAFNELVSDGEPKKEADKPEVEAVNSDSETAEKTVKKVSTDKKT